MLDYERLGMTNYNQYLQLTNQQKWKKISDINCSMCSTGFFGTRRELKRLPEFLEPNEVVFAFCSGMMRQTITSNSSDAGVNTWLVVLTSTRFLFLDHAFWTSAIDSQSIRHEHVQAVSASQGWIFGKISIDLGSRMVTIDQVGNDDVKIMASLANRWYDTLEHAKARQHETIISSAAAMVAPKQQNITDELKKLADLHMSGALSDDEFAAAKRQVLGL